MMPRRAVLWTAALVAVVLAIWLTHRFNSARSGVRPITELPGLRRVDAADWPEFVIRQESMEPGWVAVAEPHSEPAYRTPVDPDAVGLFEPGTCGECHPAEYSGFLETAHARTSRLPGADSILGSLEPGKNRLTTRLPGFEFDMLRDGSRYFQRLRVQRDGTQYELAQPIDFVIGSGNHGQSFLSWTGDRLCQMHVSYYTEFAQWTNSPGLYQDGTADFSRPATGRCLDCHATWFAADPNAVNRYDPREFRLGVTCVRCHGAARKHVDYHRAHPDETEPRGIVHPGDLDRDGMNELCAQCHSGAGNLRQPPFTYRPGQPLREYVELDMSDQSSADDDPHSANQLARLMRSRCYQASDALNCTTCHDPHRHERGQVELFSQRCRQCHAPEACGARRRLSTAVDDRCIQCHMPSRRDAEVTAAGVGGPLMPLLRDHLVGIWPDIAALIEREIREQLDKPDTALPGSSPDEQP